MKTCTKWVRENPERKKAADARYYRENYVKARTYSNQSRDQAFSVHPDTVEWMEVLRSDPCAYCGDAMREWDHIEPRTRWYEGVPGWNEWSNLTASCKSCNRRKNARSLLSFLTVTYQ